MNLSDAEVVVTTQKEIDNNTHACENFLLSDYGEMGEFYNTCCTCYPDENNPAFRYTAWDNIPDCLISKEWFCPNFFEIRDALEQLDESETGYFMKWCKYYGHDIAIDDPHMLVTHYQDNHVSFPQFDIEAIDIPDDVFSGYQSISSNFIDTERYSYEIFDDNYN